MKLFYTKTVTTLVCYLKNQHAGKYSFQQPDKVTVSHIFKWLVLSDQQPKTQRCSVSNVIKQTTRKKKKKNLRGWILRLHFYLISDLMDELMIKVPRKSDW